jgi:Uma2 family endonuclease
MPELTLEMPARPNCVPDISVFHKMKANFLHDELTFSEKPFIAIEIVSSTQSNDEILLKFERYFLAGIQSCWLVMPSLKAISVYSKIGEYVFFNNSDTLVDTATDIQLNWGEVFS